MEVDVLLVTTPYRRSAFERRKGVQIEDRAMWAIGPTDLVLHELGVEQALDEALARAE